MGASTAQDGAAELGEPQYDGAQTKQPDLEEAHPGDNRGTARAEEWPFLVMIALLTVAWVILFAYACHRLLWSPFG